MDQIATFIILLLLVPFSRKTLASSSFDGARVGMRHVDFGGNFTKDDLVSRSALRSSRLSLKYRSGEYMIDLSIGTPVPQPISGIADTGSNVIWTQCYNCFHCFEQPTPLYDPRQSQTYSSLPCNSDECLNLANDPNECCAYSITYGSGRTQGYLITDTVRFGDTDPVYVPNMVFGCSINSTETFGETTGIIGLSRSEYSLVSQLGIDKFSYCIHADVNTISPMFLGSTAVINDPSVQSTPFVAPNMSHYFVALTGISLGSTLLPIPETLFQFDSLHESGGVIIDSGTTITRLVPQALDIVSKAVQNEVNLPIADGSKYNLPLCFSLQSGSSAPSMPNMIFHFDGADLELTMDKYMRETNDGLLCLLILETPRGFTQSIIGSLQMQNMHVLYDLSNNMLSFAPAECDKL